MASILYNTNRKKGARAMTALDFWKEDPAATKSRFSVAEGLELMERANKHRAFLQRTGGMSQVQ